MPFTPAHAAAVLPLGRTGLPMSALVVGSMVPDLPMFLPGRPGYAVTHSWWGVLTLDVVAALVVVAVWFALVREPAADVVPGVRDRVPARASLTRRQWALAPLAAAVGALTHVVWDAATHEGRWIVARVPWLQAEHAGLLGLQWAQYASGVLGLVVVIVWAAVSLGRRPVVRREARVGHPWAWAGVAPAAALVGGLAGLAAGDGPAGRLVGAAVAGVQGLVLGALVVAAAWHVAVRRPVARGVG